MWETVYEDLLYFSEFGVAPDGCNLRWSKDDKDIQMKDTIRIGYKRYYEGPKKLIADKVNELVAELAEKENILIVFKTNNIIYANEKIDLTDIILLELNKKEGEFNFQKIYTDMIENLNK